MSQSPFYGNNGGGFLPSDSGSQAPGSGGGARKAVQYALRPLTIKQLLDAQQVHSDAEFFIDNVELGQLTVVAHVMSIQPQATNSVYWLDDGSGRFEVRHWAESSDEGEETESSIKEGQYVRVTGSLKNFHQKKYINATHIRPVTDYNEVVYHMMEAAYVQQVFTRGPPGNKGANGMTTNGNGNGNMSAYSAGPTGGGSQFDQYSHLSPLQKSIVNFILQQPQSDVGVHVSAIARSCQSDAVKISEALDSLMDEGHVFSTIDESHFNVSR